MDQLKIEEHHNTCELAKKRVKYQDHGPWDNEPNRVNWKNYGLDCMIVRHYGLLHLCGYVGVKPGHKFFGVDYDDISNQLEVHGGLTYSSECAGFICHASEDPEDKTWWLGFDCAHSGDISPQVISFDSSRSTYKEIAYVTGETNELARQISELCK